jgi:hypothetical protein
MTTPDPTARPDQPPQPPAWGAGLPEPGSRPLPAWFRVAWILWCLAWALAWLAVRWMVVPPLVTVPMGVASLAAIFAVHRPPDRSH